MFMVCTPKNLSENMETLTTSSHAQYSEAREPSSIWKRDENEQPLASAVLDVDWLITQPLMPFIVQVAPAHLLYRSLISHGLEDSLEVIEWVRGEQLQKILDFDIWDQNLEFNVGDISFSKALSWVKVWLEIGSEFAAKRFYELEEETIVLILSKFFEILPEGVGIISEDVRENWLKTADNKFYLRINEDDAESFEILKPFIDALYSYNPRMAASVFAHAAMLIRQEFLTDGLKWKAARLADQGFVSKEEAQAILVPKTLNELKKSVSLEREIEKKKQEILAKYPKNHLTETHSIDPEITQQLTHFLSTFEPDEGIRYLQLAMGIDEVKKITGSENIDPSYFYEDDDFISESAEKIIALCNRILSKVELKSANKKQHNLLLIEEVFSSLAKTNESQAIFIKERVAKISNVFVSAFLRQIDNQSLGYALSIVRGALNIGLQYALENKTEFSLAREKNETALEASVAFINEVGPEFVFHLGWNLIHSLPKDLSKELVLLDTTHEKFKNKFMTVRNIKMLDDSFISLSIEKLIEKRRYADVKKWLASLESVLSVEAYIVIESLLDNIPQFNELIAQKGTLTNKITPIKKPFETLNELELAKLFIKNIQHINLIRE